MVEARPEMRCSIWHSSLVGRLTEADRFMIVESIFSGSVATMIEPFARYFELYQRRNEGGYTENDYRDIQVWWTRAWLDEYRRPADLMQKGRAFAEADKTSLREIVLKTIGDVVPEYRRRQDQGTI